MNSALFPAFSNLSDKIGVFCLLKCKFKNSRKLWVVYTYPSPAHLFSAPPPPPLPREGRGWEFTKKGAGDGHVHTTYLMTLKWPQNDLDLFNCFDIWPVSYAYDFKGEYVSISEKITPIALIVPEILNLKVLTTLTLMFDFKV